MQRCKAALRLLKSDIPKQPRQTHQRNDIAKRNLTALFEISADVCVLRSLTLTVTELGSKRDYGLAPVLTEWWTGVQHPRSLSNISRDLCVEFGLQYLDDANISKTIHQDDRVSEVSTSGGLDLVTTGMDSDNRLFHEGENPEGSSRGMPDQYHAQLDRRDENPLQI
ncbi:uncharacterized protein AKAW2_50551S [Aspergillus luchuensis]|uniref:Uncharacterized protein n=1 Tax=Aspergillus kawachii TaxID=1069201 RepID=A0A7R7WCJ2_ASPKA|nr:uncharacterized protein AKAW2_50551S [Aspergillus luchuensis]BCS00210.1 hypothetical protein AKAW2_50551S [Aspergillus luchuensis]